MLIATEIKIQNSLSLFIKIMMDGQERRGGGCMNGRNLKDVILLLAMPGPPGSFSEEIQFEQGTSSEPRICSASEHLPPSIALLQLSYKLYLLNDSKEK